MVAVWRKREEEFRRLKQDEYKPSEDDDRRCLYGVLLAGEIERLANERNLIKPFEKVHLKPAAYQLTVGNEYFVGGEYFTLDGDDKTIVIRPFEVVVVKTHETICMPRYLIARWNIKVTLAYKGLLWVGGPQVDPGYVGHLFCPIYNLSNRDVTIKFRDEIAVIDFTKTTSFEKDKVGQSEYERYPWPPRRVIIEDYGIDDLKSALYHYVKERVDKMEASVGSVENRLAWFTTLVLTIFAIAHSTVKCNGQISGAEENLARGLVAEYLSGARVEFVLDPLDIGIGQNREVGTFWEVLPEEAVSVFVEAAFPRVIGLGKIG